MADSTHPQASRPLPRPEITKPPGRLARLAGAAGILLVGVLAACGSATGGASSTTPHRGGNLVIDTDTPVSDFDVWSTSDNESIWCLDQITQALYANSSDGKSVYPLLATSYSLSTNDLTWTIQLRHGVRFSNGAEMTSKDVVFSIQQEANQTNDTGWGFLDAQIASVTAEGSYTVAITTKYPWAPMLADLAFFGNAIVPYNYGGETHAQFYQNPIGTGPFMISKWVKGNYIKLVRNPYYWQPGLPYLDSLTFQAVADANTRVLQLRGGQAQIIEDVPFNEIKSVESAGQKVGLFPSTRIDYVTMNELNAEQAYGMGTDDANTWFTDPHVRAAISYALDTKAIMNAITDGYGTAASSPLMSSVEYYSPVSLDSGNLAMAKQELSESSFPNGGFSIDFITTSQDPIQYSVAEIVKQDLASLNITVNLRLLDPSAVTSQEQTYHFGMRETYWTNDIIDPDEYTSFVLEGGTGSVDFANNTHFDDPTLDSLIAQSETTFNATQRAQLYLKIQQLAADDAPIIWLGDSPYHYGYKTDVHGYTVYPTGNAHFEDVWLSS